MPRKDLSISDKIAILELIKKQPTNTSQRRLAEITGVPKSTIARILQQQHKILHELTLYKKGKRRLSQKRKREGKDPDVEEALNQWFSIVTSRDIHVSGPVLKSKSEELAKKLGHNDFKATDGWLSRWKARSGIKFKRVYGEKESVEQQLLNLPNLLKTFKQKDIYNTNERSNYPEDEDDISKQTTNQEVMKHVDELPCFLQEGMEDPRNEELFNSMLYQMTPQTQNKPQQNISAALGKPINTERSRKSPLNIASTSNSMVEAIEVENASPPAKKPREIHIDVDVSEEESPVVSKPLLQPTIEPPAQKSVTTSMKSTPAQPSSVVHNPVLDINVPQKQKRILVVPNHQQSVMSNLSSLWKAGRLCDAFISNGTVNVKVHKMILGAVCPKVLDVFYSTPQHKLPKVTFPNSVSKEALLAFAEYMYNGVLDLDPDLLAQMKVIAQRLDMKDFEQLCNNQLKSSLVPNVLPTILEPMLSEPCSSSGLIQQMSPQGNQTSIMEMIPASTRAHQKDAHTVESLDAISNAVSNCSNSVSLSNLPLVEVRAETDDTLMEVVNNNFALSVVNDNNCDINVNNRPQVKIEKVDPEDQQRYGRESVSSSINYSTSDSIITSNFTNFSNPDLSQSSSSPISTSQHTDNTLNKSLPGGHVWKQSNKDKRNTVEDVNNTDPYPISLFTANWANLPLLTKEIKKEYNVE